MKDNTPWCQFCGLALHVHGCTAERCANPATESVTVAGETYQLRAEGLPCNCERCTEDGLHARTCAVHEDPPEPCNCREGG